MTDDHDRRLLRSLLSTFLCTEVYSDENNIFFDNKAYYAPIQSEYKSYLKYIKSLPMYTHPQVSFSTICIFIQSIGHINVYSTIKC